MIKRFKQWQDNLENNIPFRWLKIGICVAGFAAAAVIGVTNPFVWGSIAFASICEGIALQDAIKANKKTNDVETKQPITTRLRQSSKSVKEQEVPTYNIQPDITPSMVKSATIKHR